MLRTTLVSLFCQNRTFSPRLTSKIAQHVEKLSGNISKRHSDTTTTAPVVALADLAELRNVEHDLDQCRQAQNAEREAVEAAVRILTGEPVFYYGDHPLVRHAEDLVTQTTAVGMVDDDLSVLDLSDEIALLTELQSELNDAATVANNRIQRATEETRKARGLALCRCKDTRAAVQNLPPADALPTRGDWAKVDINDPKTLINKCRLAAKADQASFATKRKKTRKKIANKKLIALKEVN